ncbi:YopX family protein [Streptococcus hyointestinalis]|nr:YopX family protein [Streptococcus hyointestinalis]
MKLLKFRAWSMVNDEPEMRKVEGINWHGGGVWFNEIIDDATPADWADFDDVILMQSAGLFDANGREVFAGDIVLINRPPFDCQGVVKYYNGCWWIVCGGIAFSLYDEIEESLVIGNIYENKELVESDEL